MHPVFLKIGSFEIATYGVMTALGYLAASFYLLPRLKKVPLDKDTFWNLLFVVFVGALIGAKLLFIFVSWPELGITLQEKLTAIIQNFRYGFVFFGGMIVAVISLIAYMKYKKLPILKTSDFLIVGVPLGHALGRIGCFCAGCCYGKPTSMPWGVTFTDPQSLVPPSLLGVALHPTQLYECAGNLILFLLLHCLSQKPHKEGTILVTYILGYSLLRFIIEFFRADFRGNFFLGLSPSQCISLVAALIAFIIWLKSLRKNSHA